METTILRRGQRDLPCKLGDREWLELGRQLAAVLDEISNQASHAEEMRQALKAKMATLEAERDRLRTLVLRGVEMRMVEVVEEAHHDVGEAWSVRADTLETIATRTLTDEERQLPLPLAAAEPDGPEAA